MPRNPLAAKRYAQALFQICEKTESAKALQELKAFSEALTKNADLEEFFTSPVVSKLDKRNILGELKEKLPLTQRFLATLIESGRMGALRDIVEEFEREVEAISGELSVQLEVARPLTGTSEEDIRSLLQEKWKRKIKFQTKVNPDLLGGFVARGPGKVFDASVSSQLDALQQQVFSS